MQNPPLQGWIIQRSGKLDDDTYDLPCVLLSVHANLQLEHGRGALITLDTE
jgi:hypothetical protein